MGAIRLKIYIAIALLLMAMGVATVIYSRGGSSFTSEKEFAYCGTSSIEPIITNFSGQRLYSSYYASCHAITKDLTGPALAGFQSRLSDKYFYLLIQNPKKAYKKS